VETYGTRPVKNAVLVAAFFIQLVSTQQILTSAAAALDSFGIAQQDCV